MSKFSLYKDSLEKLIEISFKAGKEIMEIYNTDFEFTKKVDQSPLTSADLRSHEIISDSLSKLSPKIPIISEESLNISFSERSRWELYWLIDPLDGTKEFINKNGQFTTNIALIKKNKPIFGIIHAPAINQTFWGGESIGSFSLEGNSLSDIKKINVSENINRPLKIVMSRSHPSKKIGLLIDKLDNYEPVYVGSSIKFCLIANGEADCYPRLGPTCEWDTAAGQAIVEFAGGITVTVDNEYLSYNKKSDRCLNPSFIVSNNESNRDKIIGILNSIL